MAKNQTVGEPEPESTYLPREIIKRAQTAIGVPPEVAAGALSGCKEPMTLTDARQRVADFVNKEVR